MKKKILFVATSDIHLAIFHKPYIQWLNNQGVQVDIAVENRGDENLLGVSNSFFLQFPRSLTNSDLFSSYNKLKQIIDEGVYDLVHCHTPIPSFLARLAARKARKMGPKFYILSMDFIFIKVLHY